MTRSPRRSPFRGTARDRGAAAVEFALVVPLLLLLVCGMIDFARAYNSRAELSEAAAEGARTLALGKTVVEAKTQVSGVLKELGLDPALVSYPKSPKACPSATPAAMTLRLNYRPITPFISQLFPSIPIVAAGSGTCFV